MAYQNMWNELFGAVAGIDAGLCRTFVRRAWSVIRDTRLWSFQCGESGFLVPALINGVFTCTLGQNTVTANAATSAAILGLTNPAITKRQFRVLGYGIYNIISTNEGNPAAIILTLDRPYLEIVTGSQSGMVFQCYVAAPVSDFKRFLSVRDMVLPHDLDIYRTRREIDETDPKRLIMSPPRWIVPYIQDTRVGSDTLGSMLFELYPHPGSLTAYMAYWLRTGADLLLPTDVLPPPHTEDCVLARARVYAYEWAEANRSSTEVRGHEADFKFLTGLAEAEFKESIREIGKKDRDMLDLYKSRLRNYTNTQGMAYYSSLIGRASSGL